MRQERLRQLELDARFAEMRQELLEVKKELEDQRSARSKKHGFTFHSFVNLIFMVFLAYRVIVLSSAQSCRKNNHSYHNLSIGKKAIGPCANGANSFNI